MIKQLIFDPTCALCQTPEFEACGQLFQRRGGSLSACDKLSQETVSVHAAVDETLFLSDHNHQLIQATKLGMMVARVGADTVDVDFQTSVDYCLNSIDDLTRLLDKDFFLNNYSLVLPTVGGLIQAESTLRILLVQTRKWSNKWGTPGGKMDYGETMEEAYYREIYEETGIRLQNAHWVMSQDCIEHPEFIYPRHFILINYYSTISHETELCSNYESQNIGWYKVETALQMDLNEPTRALLEATIERKIILEQK